MSAKPAIILPSAVIINGRVYDALLYPDNGSCVTISPLNVPDTQIDIPLSELRKIVETMEAHPKPPVQYMV